MMEMTPQEFGDSLPIDGYGPGFFRIGGVVYQGPVILYPGVVLPWGGMDDLQAISALKGKADLLLIGTGAQTLLASDALLDCAEAAGLRAEAMASPSAARTYNVLLGQSRFLAAALLPI